MKKCLVSATETVTFNQGGHGSDCDSHVCILVLGVCLSIREAQGCSLKISAYQAQWTEGSGSHSKVPPLLMEALSELVMVSGASRETAEKCWLDPSGFVCVSLGRWG